MDKRCNIFTISDTHFFHTNIIKYCNRPFTAEEQDEAMIKRWNSVVREGDVVIHVGDFALHKDSEKVHNIIHELNGSKILVKGNHDRKSNHWYMTNGFSFVCDSFVLDNIIYTHRPVDKIENWKFNIFGHIHDKVLPKYENSKYICVSVEKINYTPILIETLIKKRDNK